MLSPNEILVACPLPLEPAFLQCGADSTPCSRSDLTFFRQSVAFDLRHQDLVIWTNGFFPFGKGGSGAEACAIL